MANDRYDVITIGGGLGGAALAKAMAEHGAKVLVLEATTQFKDRIRGEQLNSWGADEARKLGVYDLLVDTCANKMQWWDQYIGSARFAHRNLPEEAASGLPNLGYYHPKMQETLIRAAEEAGAKVRRGVRVTGIQPGSPASVVIEGDEKIAAGIIAACDGRSSAARAWCRFDASHERDRMAISGLFFQGMNIPPDTALHYINPVRNGHALLFPSGGGGVRAYLGLWKRPDTPWFSGEKDVPGYIEQSVAIGMPESIFEGATPSGPLATFNGADTWVDHPYRGGVALVGDAAAANDPNFGQGQALTLRDVRELRDQLLSGKDPDTAGHTYAEAHDHYFGKLKSVEDVATDLLFEPGPEADARRGRTLSAMREVFPEMALLQSGPDHVDLRPNFRELVLA